MNDRRKKLLEQVARIATSSSAVERDELLYSSQRTAVSQIVQRIRKLAAERSHVPGGRGSGGGGEDSERKSRPLRWCIRDVEIERPHQAFVVDGARGSGKTVALLTIRKRLQDAKEDRRVGARRVALVLQIIIPSNMLDHEIPMEALLCEIADELRYRQSLEQWRDEKDKLKEIEALLQKEVLIGWTFAQPDARSALANDALDFRDYTHNRAENNILSYQRIESWYVFVERFLDTLGYDLLVPIFDDTDLDPAAAEKIVQDIAQFLSHPRIVSVVGADLANLVTTLTHNRVGRAVRQLGGGRTVAGAEYGSGLSLSEIRRNAGELASSRADKVLPKANRFRIKFSEREDIDSVLVDYTTCEFFVENFRSFYKLSQNKSGIVQGSRDIRGGCRAAAIESWLINSAYSALLLDSIRGASQIIHALLAAESAASDEASGEKAQGIQGRLRPRIVDHLLSYSRARFLAEMVSASEEIGDLIAAGRLAPLWGFEGSDPFDLNERRRRADPYSIMLCDYWTDIEIAASFLHTAAHRAPRQWLPMELSSVQPRLPPWAGSLAARAGVAGIVMDGRSLLPWSCLYCFQLRYLEPYLNYVARNLGYESQAILRLDTPFEPRALLPLLLQIADRNSFAGVEAFLFPPAFEPKIRSTKRRQEESSENARISLNNYAQILLIYAMIFILLKNRDKSHGRDKNEMSIIKILFDSIYKTIIKIDREELDYYSVQEIVEIFANANPSMDGYKLFFDDIMNVVVSMDRMQRYFISQWYISNKIADLGNDYSGASYRMSAEYGTLDEAFEALWRSLDNFQGKESFLLQASTRARGLKDSARSARTVVLHAWSLVPIVRGLCGEGRPLFAVEFVSGDIEKRTHAWEQLRQFVASARESLQEVVSQQRSTAKAPISKPRKNAAAGAAPEVRPEDFLRPKDLRDWYFPDMTDEQLQRIDSDLAGLAEFLAREIQRFPSDAVPLDQRPATDPARWIGRLLGVGPMTADWICDRLARD